MPVDPKSHPTHQTAKQPVEEELPSFVKGWMVADIVFCALRGWMVPFSIFGYSKMYYGDPLYPTALFEIISSAALVIVGLVAAIMILRQKIVGIPFAYLTVLCTFATFGVGAWQLSINLQQIYDSAERSVWTVVGLLLLSSRVILLGFYITAVNKAKDFFYR